MADAAQIFLLKDFASEVTVFEERAWLVVEEVKQMAQEAVILAKHYGTDLTDLELVKYETGLTLGQLPVAARYDFKSGCILFTRETADGPQPVGLAVMG